MIIAQVSLEEEKATSKEEISFEEFKRNEPEEIVIKKAGMFGEDLVLRKKTLNGIVVYTVPCNFSFLQERSPGGNLSPSLGRRKK